MVKINFFSHCCCPRVKQQGLAKCQGPISPLLSTSMRGNPSSLLNGLAWLGLACIGPTGSFLTATACGRAFCCSSQTRTHTRRGPLQPQHSQTGQRRSPTSCATETEPEQLLDVPNCQTKKTQEFSLVKVRLQFTLSQLL